ISSKPRIAAGRQLRARTGAAHPAVRRGPTPPIGQPAVNLFDPAVYRPMLDRVVQPKAAIFSQARRLSPPVWPHMHRILCALIVLTPGTSVRSTPAIYWINTPGISLK